MTQNSSLQTLWDEFLTTWPLERIEKMTLPDYVSTQDKTTFTYWLETKTQPLANIKGSPSPKFGIYKRNSEPKERTGMIHGNEYSWWEKYGATEQQAFKNIRNEIITIIKAARDGDIKKIDEVELAPVYKWKIAFMYQDQHAPNIINIFAKDKLAELTGLPSSASYPELYDSLMQNYSKAQHKNIAEYGRICWSRLDTDKTESIDDIASDASSNIVEEINVMPLNQILYGPPGTGKTYHTIEAAVKAAEPEFYRELNINPQHGATKAQRSTLQSKYQALCDEKRIRFVTFHQSYGYEEFVEGLRADTLDGQIHYKVEAGIFKKSVNRAKAKHVSQLALPSSYSLDKRKIWKMSLGNTLTNEGEMIFKECIDNNYVLLGYGEDIDFAGCDSPAKIKQKFIDAGYEIKPQDYNVTAVNTLVNKMSLGDLVIVSDGNYKIKAIAEITSDYSCLNDERDWYFQKRDVKWLMVFDESRPVDELCSSVLSQMTLYHLKDSVISRDKLSALLNESKQALEQVKNHVLVIDEINRGNISKIFGELITLIEPSKRQGEDEALSLTLPYSGDSFSVPNNLHIIGTMNTADRSLAMMDTALRRRFDFVEMMPKPELLAGCVVAGIDLEQLLTTLNKRIEILYDREHTLGHAFFMPVKALMDAGEKAQAFTALVSVFQNKVIPLLEEYFFEDWHKIRLVLADNQKQAALQFVREQKQESNALNSLFGHHHGLDQYGEAVVLYALADKADSVWREPNAYRGIYAPVSSSEEPEPSVETSPEREGVEA